MGVGVNQHYTEHCSQLIILQKLTGSLHVSMQPSLIGVYLDLEPNINDAFASYLVSQGELV